MPSSPHTHLAVSLALTLLASACGWSDVRKPQVPSSPAAAAQPAPDLYAHEVERIDGRRVSLSAYRGQAMLIVNTASACGFTPQYAGLQELHERYGGRGLAVLGFPCDDFGGQEPGGAAEISAFCAREFRVTFPLFAKIRAKGDEAAPLYRDLIERTPAGIQGPIKWNFTKFLVDPAGRVVARFEPAVDPLDPRVIAELERVLPAAGAEL